LSAKMKFTHFQKLAKFIWEQNKRVEQPIR